MTPAMYATSLGGQKAPDAKTTHSVSYWHLPGGYDVNRARACVVYFDNEDSAKIFRDKYADRDEMAFLSPYPDPRSRAS